MMPSLICAWNGDKGITVGLGIVIAYFAEQSEADKAQKKLAQEGYSRTALLYRSSSGEIHRKVPILRRPFSLAILAALLSGGGSALVIESLRLFPGTEFSSPLTVIFVLAALSALAAFVITMRIVQGFGAGIVRDHTRWLLPGESVLILLTAVDRVLRPVTMLRESSEIPPALFVMHPRRERRAEMRPLESKLSPIQILEHARRHAREQQLGESPERSAELLKRIKRSRKWLRQVCADLTIAGHLEQKTTPAADWILDNEYILEGTARDILLNLPRRYYLQLPSLASAPYRGLPAIYALAKDLVSHNELRLDRENVVAFIEAHQSVRTLSIGELWAIPQMLRIALLESIQSLAVTALEDMRERQLADFWANRLIASNRRDSNELFAILAELAKVEPLPTQYFGTQLVNLLYDEAAALAPVKNWLERVLKNSLHDLNLREQNRLTREQLSCGNAFSSLRQLALLDWREIFEKLSRVEQLLRFDPSGVYPKMDFASRDRCHRAIEEISRAAARSEEQIAEAVIKCATQAGQEQMDDQRRRYVGSWLVGEGRAEVVRLLNCRESFRYRTLEWLYRHHTGLYAWGIGGFTGLLLFLVAAFGQIGRTGHVRLYGLILLLLIPLSQLAIEVVNYILTRTLPTRPLPKMDFKDTGIPDAFRTLVVVPMMLANRETIQAEVEKLEIRFLANKEVNLVFSLFSDYTDSVTPARDDDSQLLAVALQSIAALNSRYGDGRFFLFHRERIWSQTEQKFIGWERKRGKLEELNRLIEGTRPKNDPPLVYVGDADQLADIRFVITLDSDTQLPHATARRLVETLAHPLNQPRFDADGGIQAGSYTIIQPRVSPTLPSTTASTFSRLFADAVGIDPYSQAISDVYQDLCGEGSYHGKGIYDVRAFSRVLSGRFPEEWVLSHDLIEGAHVRVGLASDIELYDEFPQGYQSYSSRAHRWIRGDWQIAGWIGSHVPHASGGRAPNPLSLLNRWKILDNLRRSLLPVASLALLITSWCISARIGEIATFLVGVQLLFHPLAQPFTIATTGKGLKFFSLTKLLHDMLRAIADAALLPHQAAVALDAIVRVIYRRLFSLRNLLEWSAQATLWSASRRQPLFVASLALGSILSIVVLAAVQLTMPTNLLLAAPWLLLWFFSPLLGWLLNRPPTEQRSEPLPEVDRIFLRQVARRTWRYFSSFVNDDTSWLPPDNYQVSHQNRLAMRTSPTNIGLWMTSALGANDAGYLTVNQVIEVLSRTMASIDRLERYEGHLLNWYDIQTLAPLEPRYVSAVDSGNLLGALWALDEGVNELLHAPLLSGKTFKGLADTGRILNQTVSKEKIAGFCDSTLAGLVREWDDPPSGILDLIRLERRTASNVTAVSASAAGNRWAGELADQTAALQEMTNRYLAWIEILAEKSLVELAPLGPEPLLAILHDLSHSPSIYAVANAESTSIILLAEIREKLSAVAPQLSAWLDRVMAAYADAQWMAGETLAMGTRLIEEIRRLSAALDMGFLYDSGRKLFAIGFNVSSDIVDSSCYDLLASEARFGSFVAVARGDVPLEHWFSMGRPYGAIGRQRVLLSWSGTMFEYLMPLLFQRSYGNSLLEKAVREAVAVQIAFGKAQSVPWGISESAYGNMDLNKTYQYKAFGVPSLGLKRGGDDQLVVAPYATLLALNVSPVEAVVNLKRLDRLGLLGEYGYYEAMDFSRQPQRDSENRKLKRGVIVEAYMAHHQGMAFVSLINFLHDGPFPRRFHSDPRVRAFEPLLQERIPTLPPLNLNSTRQSMPSLLETGSIAPAESTFTTPHTAIPHSLLLGNGRYGVMVTNSGGGYSQWGRRELTRWRSDPTCDRQGTYCYIHGSEPDELWSSTYQPVGGEIEGYSVNFALDRAVFQRDNNGIHTVTEVVVSPEDDTEIRRITLINRTGRTRLLSLTSYVELSMAPHIGDRQHPAFNKLFIQTEAIPALESLIAYRRLRSDNDPPLYLAHRLTYEKCESKPSSAPRTAATAADEAFQFETDRGRFIGRGRTLANPMGAVRNLDNSQGFVLDPMLGLRRSFALDPGQRVQVSLVIAAGESREQVLRLMEKYSEPHAIDRAMDFAWGSAQQQLQILHIKPDEARRFQQLSSHMLFPNPLLRAAGERISENRKGQSGLWAYGISGDLPIAVVTIGEARDISLSRQMLQAHNYWRMHGLSSDLVIINEEAESYERPLQEQLERLIHTHSLLNGTDQPGGIFLLNAAVMPEEDLTLIKSVGSVLLVAARGTLPQQLGAPVELPERVEPMTRKRTTRDPSAPLPFMELHYFNSLGGFTQDGHEYVIYLGPDTSTPAPWVNVIANPLFGTMISETGAGFTWYGNSQRNRLSAWSNDPVLDPVSEAIYIRDEESGVFWSPTAAPIREATAYRARHGAGFSVFEHNSHGIEQELTVFVPVDGNGGEPIKLQRLQLTNATSRRRRLSVTWYVELTLGEHRETSQMHIITSWDNESQALLARNCYHPDYGDRVTFVAMVPQVDSYSGDRTAFVGRNRTLANPAAMDLTRLSQGTGAALDPCGAVRIDIEMAAGEKRDVTCILGQTASLAEARLLLEKYRADQSFEDAFDQSRAWWDELLGTIQVKTPELAADLLVNRWLQYQSLSCRIWGRSAFYQSGGAFGFRDQLQDVMAFMFTRPELARDQIILAASRQFKEGDVQHWWHPPGGAGIRSRISDDLLWLPYLVAHYVRTTGDTALLSQEVPFLNAPLLADDQHELFSVPEATFESGTLFEHCRRAVSKGLTVGPHGLPLIGTGDWNDGLNLVGAGGKGESVWLAWFLCSLLEGMAELSQTMEQPELSRNYQEERYALIQRVELAGWDGEWYLRGTYDDGTLLGSAVNPEARIDSLPQSWAWLSSAADPLRADQALESAWQHLVCKEDALVLLFEPPFNHSQPSPGYIKGYPPGVRENGGQYTHAALWMAMAMARKGDGDRAVQLLRMLSPIEHARDSEAAWLYGIEPYVVAADVYRLPGMVGRGGWSWYTGSAAWMYRAWIEEVLGLDVRGEEMWINPVIPKSWPGFSINYRHDETLYLIQVENPDACQSGVIWIEMDGHRITDRVIPLERGLVKHQVVVRMGYPGADV